MDISFKHVSYTYQPNGPFEYKALRDLNFSIKSGSYVAIIGHTGSGKSTLIQHLNGLLKPTQGEVQIGNYVIRADQKLADIKELRRQVGVVFQYPEHQLFEETIEKDIAFGPENFGVSKEEVAKRIPEVMNAVGLSQQLLDRSPFDLSGGQMRRVAIAGILAMEPSVLVLDEPTAGLDPKGQQEIMEMFYDLHKRRNLTTILVTHSMEDALKYADHVIILEAGQIKMEGKPEEIFVKSTELEHVQLDTPEIIRFLQDFKEKFGIEIAYHNQSVDQLAIEVVRALKEVKQNG
ncbi:energy-coupling factor ABC transporter ATP-binding protein [Amphibacillus xylanus]|uniref:Energy-coupling factor transporter ATP-binding protein EcfA2 n=1 Tax=Amphibacillus xylanus (strain ATCC 51415 / DSM 6626 / JCM 7361 / LMG 17667 / NBRC 15112 / Ep01) TaxID=698758 RepID=K0IV97_AMPXN|nr:energy-coupling factor ABC transporter ATP-binding protein [Amphibacillus xylanus]BAM46285.1 putative ABC transporter ATP-binding protein [Amphibacillus xylanus NBRC 15112]